MSDLSHDQTIIERELDSLIDHCDELIARRVTLSERWPDLISVSDSARRSAERSTTHHEALDERAAYTFEAQTSSAARELRELRDQINARAPLKALLLGGSGVGKSTLLNALAGDEISSTSHTVRAHTSGLIIYTHAAWSETPLSELAPSWSHELCERSERAEHTADALHDVWVIDAPDVDSTELIHRARTLEALREADLPIIVTSPEKYRDRAYLSALQRIDPRRVVVFVMTSIDRVWAEQRADLMRDAMRSVDELGFAHATWIALDARADQVKHLTEETAEGSPRDLAVGLASLRDLLERGIDSRRAARLKAGRFTQRLITLSESLAPRVLVASAAQLKRAEAWRRDMRERLTPALIECLSRAHELDTKRAQDLTSVMLAPSTSRLNAPLRLCWSICLSPREGEREASRLKRELKTAQRAAAILIQRRLDELPTLSGAESQRSTHLSVDELERGLLDALSRASSRASSQALPEPMITPPTLNLKRYGAIHLGLSASLFVAQLTCVGDLSALTLIVSLIAAQLITACALAWVIRRAHPPVTPITPHYNREARHAIELLESNHYTGALWDALRSIERYRARHAGEGQRHSDADLEVTLEVMTRDVHDYSSRHERALAQLDERLF